ncbi:MAG: ATP-binding protein [Candidatus Neomarinimicrobiota bacterium]
MQRYRFEVRHFIILFIVLATFQLFLSYLHKVSSRNLLEQSMSLYRKDSAVRLANLTTTSLELLVEQSLTNPTQTEANPRKIIQAFNIIMNQQTLQQNVDQLCIVLSYGGKPFIIDQGEELYALSFHNQIPDQKHKSVYAEAIRRYTEAKDELLQTEQINCTWDNIQSFHVLVPYVPKGEFEGVVYMKISPDLSKIVREISTVYDETSIVFTALILFGLLAMFYITSYTVKERDQAQELLFREREDQIKNDIEHQKEALFTKRIYHAHHKAEKIMGFIKEEIRNLSETNITAFKFVATKYSNFISRVIYDMKWFKPPIHATRNAIFSTDINQVIQFLVKYIFQRVYKENSACEFKLEFDSALPPVQINEYVIWEILEPLIQNCVDHNQGQNVVITIRTKFDAPQKRSTVLICDNGKGIDPDLLKFSESGVRKIFLEHTSTRENAINSGYGCYIAYELSVNRCGWSMDARNAETGGAVVVITIPSG